MTDKIRTLIGERDIPFPNVVLSFHGSRLYGTSTPESDWDFRGVFIPTTKDLVLGTYKDEYSFSTGEKHGKNKPGDIDCTIQSLRKFLADASRGDTKSLDMLHGDENHLIDTSEIWSDLQYNRAHFYTKNMASLVDYIKGQADKYGLKGGRINAIKEALDAVKHQQKLIAELHGEYSGVKVCIGDVMEFLPENEHVFKVTTVGDDSRPSGLYYEVCGKKYQSSTQLIYVVVALQKLYDKYGERSKQAASNEGIDWKAIHHAFRAAYQVKDIFELGSFSYPLKQNERLIDIKSGNLDYIKYIQPALESLVEEVQLLSAKSDLPEEVDKQFFDDWYYRWVKCVGDKQFKGVRVL